MSFYSFFLGILLGLSLAAPPGPINAIMAYESTKSKYNGISVGAGAMTADAIFFTLTYLFYQVIPLQIIKYFYFLGGIIMIYLAYLVLKSKEVRRTARGNYLVGLTVGLTNPFQITWWLTAGLSMINQLSIYVIPGFFTGILIWIILFPLVINQFSVKYNITKFIKIFSFIILLIFGLYLLYNGFSKL